MGYDVFDYQVIYVLYGDVDDVDQLLKECYQRNMKVILDFVVNYMLFEYFWFKDFCFLKESSKCDWYIWKFVCYDSNGVWYFFINWRGYFVSLIWIWDDVIQEYYLYFYVVD